MNPAYWSLGALIVTVVVSCATEMNAGVLAMALAWLVGVLLGGITAEQIVAGFPSSLFLTLVGVILLFTQAQANGTLERMALRAVRLCRGNAGLIPIVFFWIAAALATIGPGNIATAALLAPVAMAVAVKSGVPAFLMAIMVGNGANAGALSPLAPTGIIAANMMTHIGLGGVEWRTYTNNLFAHAAVAFGGYFLLGGWKLFRRSCAPADPETDCLIFEKRHWITVGVIFLLVAGVICFKINVGFAAFAGAVILFALGAADHDGALRRMPWGVIVLVCGFTVLIGVLEKTSGMKLFTDLLAQFSTPRTVTAVVAFVAGVVSVYASTSGVILPTFLPTVPGLVEHLPGANAMAIASSINVGGHLVDVSPLSTIGALCLASLPAGQDSRLLFNQLLAWGLSMSVVGAIVCYLMFR